MTDEEKEIALWLEMWAPEAFSKCSVIDILVCLEHFKSTQPDNSSKIAELEKEKQDLELRIRLAEGNALRNQETAHLAMKLADSLDEHVKNFQQSIPNLTQKMKELKKLSVTNILLDVEKWDESGKVKEIYAQSCEDIEKEFANQAEKQLELKEKSLEQLDMIGELYRGLNKAVIELKEMKEQIGFRSETLNIIEYSDKLLARVYKEINDG